MIRVIVDLVPHGDESRTRRIGLIEIANDATGNNVIGNYSVAMTTAEPHENAYRRGIAITEAADPNEVRTAAVTGFERVRGVYALLYRALEALGADQP